MDNGENIEKNSSNKISREKLIIILIISVIAYFFISCTYKIISHKMRAESLYKQQVLEYLQEKYDEEFDIEFVEKGYKEKTYGSGNMTLYFGHDKNIDEYLYSFSPKNNTNIKCYVRYWYKIDDNSYEISEKVEGILYNNGDTYNIDTYEKSLEYYNQKLEIQHELEIYLGNEYAIELFSDTKNIYAISNKNLEEIVGKNASEYTDLYNKLMKLISDKNIFIKLKYQDDKIVDIDRNFRNEEKRVDEILELIETE